MALGLVLLLGECNPGNPSPESPVMRVVVYNLRTTFIVPGGHLVHHSQICGEAAYEVLVDGGVMWQLVECLECSTHKLLKAIEWPEGIKPNWSILQYWAQYAVLYQGIYVMSSDQTMQESGECVHVIDVMTILKSLIIIY